MTTRTTGAPEWMTPAEATAWLGIGLDALRKRAERGEWGTEHMTRTPGGHRRYRREFILGLPRRTS
jgi:hypothetical protein